MENNKKCGICKKPLKVDETEVCKSCQEVVESLPPTARNGCKYCKDKDFTIIVRVEKRNKNNKLENYYDYDINYCPCCGTKIEDIDF